MKLSTEITIKKNMLNDLHDKLPDYFTRKDISNYLGSIISRGTLANLGKKNGPPYELIRNKALYEKKSFLNWLQNHFN